MKYFTFTRRWSVFAPAYTYGVDIATDNVRIGEVARNADDPRKWWASNKTWTGGGDLVQTFTSRYEAATALNHIHNGTATPETYGGYFDAEKVEREKEAERKAAALAQAAENHSPRRWYERGAYPECSCGVAPKDNQALYAHWATFGIAWYHDTRAGQLKYREVSA